MKLSQNWSEQNKKKRKKRRKEEMNLVNWFCRTQIFKLNNHGVNLCSKDYFQLPNSMSQALWHKI